MNSENLYIIKSRASVMGTSSGAGAVHASIAFGFNKFSNARVICERLCCPNVKIWHTKIKPNQFILMPTRYNDNYNQQNPKILYRTRPHIVLLESQELVNDIVKSNMALRIIQDITIDEDLFILHSNIGFEPNITKFKYIENLEKILKLNVKEDERNFKTMGI